MGEVEIGDHMQFGEQNVLNADVTILVEQSSPLCIRK